MLFQVVAVIIKLNPRLNPNNILNVNLDYYILEHLFANIFYLYNT